MILPQILSCFQEAAVLFLEYLDVHKNVSRHTLRAYTRDLQEFTAWLGTHIELTQKEVSSEEERSPIEFTQPQALSSFFRALPNRYSVFLSARGHARTTVARKLSCTQSFFKFITKERLLESLSSTEAASIPKLPLTFHRPKQPKQLPHFLTQPEVSQLLSTCSRIQDENSASFFPLRNRAIIHMLFASGIRVSELTQLNWQDLDWTLGEIRVLGKGQRERIAFVSDAALTDLRQYHALSPHTQAEDPVFLNRDGTRLTPRSVARLINQVGEQAGLSKKLHPHLFRHSFATFLLNNGVDLRAVQELLGHVSIRSTQIYTHVTTERLRKAYLSAHPRAK
ncbi:MAG: tyrosine-type recombinase/integrase [Cyanobacteria bacterium]|nr:tyrosine-type recombinase/integrase [Cyanobacteriota bacterium]